MSRLKCSKCGGYFLALHPGDLCSEHYDFEEDLNRDLTQVANKIMKAENYEKHKDDRRKKAKDRAREKKKQKDIEASKKEKN